MNITYKFEINFQLSIYTIGNHFLSDVVGSKNGQFSISGEYIEGYLATFPGYCVDTIQLSDL